MQVLEKVLEQYLRISKNRTKVIHKFLHWDEPCLAARKIKEKFTFI